MFPNSWQPPQEEHKEDEIKKEPEVVGEAKEEGTEKKEEEPSVQGKEDKGEKSKEEAKKEKPVKEKKAEKTAEEAKGSKRQKTMQCKVTLLDDTQFECELDVRQCLTYSVWWLSPLWEYRLMIISPPHLSFTLSDVETRQRPGPFYKGVRPCQPPGERLLWSCSLGDTDQQGRPVFVPE